MYELVGSVKMRVEWKEWRVAMGVWGLGLDNAFGRVCVCVFTSSKDCRVKALLLLLSIDRIWSDSFVRSRFEVNGGPRSLTQETVCAQTHTHTDRISNDRRPKKKR